MQLVLFTEVNSADKCQSLTFCSDFCGNKNEIETGNEQEIPSQSIVEYLLTPAHARDHDVTTTKGTIVYCIDVSASMSDRRRVPNLLGMYGRYLIDLALVNNLLLNF